MKLVSAPPGICPPNRLANCDTPASNRSLLVNGDVHDRSGCGIEDSGQQDGIREHPDPFAQDCHLDFRRAGVRVVEPVGPDRVLFGHLNAFLGLLPWYWRSRPDSNESFRIAPEVEHRWTSP
jgi:hypothetical protein